MTAMTTSKTEDFLTIALPKGKLGSDGVELLNRAGYPVDNLSTESRKLYFAYPEQGINYIVCRPTDIPTYVDYGAADLGIVGKDSIVESNKDLFELVDLKFGYCRFVVAIPKSRTAELMDREGQISLSNFNHTRVATKFPRVAEEFFRTQGVQVEIIKLHGNIELAPKVNLSDLIVDIVSTGATLKENDLVPIREIFSATARLIANRVSYRIKHEKVQKLVEKLRELTGEEGAE